MTTSKTPLYAVICSGLRATDGLGKLLRRTNIEFVDNERITIIFSLFLSPSSTGFKAMINTDLACLFSFSRYPQRRRVALFSVGLVSISGKWRGCETRGKNSRLVNPLLFRIYQKTSFNSTVCVGSPLNPWLCNPFRRPRLSCTNKHGNGSPHI